MKFYSQLQEAFSASGVSTPKCYYSEFEDAGLRDHLIMLLTDARSSTKMLLLLEDLSAWKNYSLGSSMDYDEAESAVKAMAKIHATFWNKRLDEVNFN